MLPKLVGGSLIYPTRPTVPPTRPAYEVTTATATTGSAGGGMEDEHPRVPDLRGAEHPGSANRDGRPAKAPVAVLQVLKVGLTEACLLFSKSLTRLGHAFIQRPVVCPI